MGLVVQKKGIFFSIDALIALLIIFLVILIAIPTTKQNKIESKIDEDILVSLSSISAEEFDNSYVQSLISSGVIDDFTFLRASLKFFIETCLAVISLRKAKIAASLHNASTSAPTKF